MTGKLVTAGLAVFLLALLAAMIATASYEVDQKQKFREVCTEQGGVPAWNGRFWECLKK
jgi:hypothetical protein